MDHLLSFIQIDNRSKVSLKKQILDQTKDFIHQHFFIEDHPFIDENTFVNYFKVKKRFYDEIVHELFQLQYLYNKNDVYYISQSQTLRYILPKPFGRRTYNKNESYHLKEIIDFQEIVTIPSHLQAYFHNQKKVLKIQKSYYNQNKLKAISTIYIHPHFSQEQNLKILDNDQYVREIEIISNDRKLNERFNLQNMLYIKGTYHILRDDIQIEYGEVITLAEYSFKMKMQQNKGIIDY